MNQQALRELTEEEREDITKILDGYRANADFADMFRFEMFVYIEYLLAEQTRLVRIDELLYLTNHADPLVLDRAWIQDRLKAFTNPNEQRKE